MSPSLALSVSHSSHVSTHPKPALTSVSTALPSALGGRSCLRLAWQGTGKGNLPYHSRSSHASTRRTCGGGTKSHRGQGWPGRQETAVLLMKCLVSHGQECQVVECGWGERLSSVGLTWMYAEALPASPASPCPTPLPPSAPARQRHIEPYFASLPLPLVLCVAAFALPSALKLFFLTFTR